VEGVRREISENLDAVVQASLDNGLSAYVPQFGGSVAGLERIGEVPVYYGDAIVRRAASLQKTRDALPPAATMHGELMQRLSVKVGDEVSVQQGNGSAVLKAAQDDRLPANCVRIAAGHPLTAALGAMFGEVTVQRIAMKASA
jgi:NADH-quinone oxidoreductase subunit G